MNWTDERVELLRKLWSEGLSASQIAARQLQPMHLADDGIAADPAKLGGDLACAQALRPQFSEKFDPLVSPVHETALLLSVRQPESIPDPATFAGADTTYIR